MIGLVYRSNHNRSHFATVYSPERETSNCWLCATVTASLPLTSARVLPSIRLPFWSYPAVYRPSRRPSFRLRMFLSPVGSFLGHHSSLLCQRVSQARFSSASSKE